MKIIETIEDFGWGMIHIRLKDGTRILVKENFLLDLLQPEVEKSSQPVSNLS